MGRSCPLVVSVKDEIIIGIGKMCVSKIGVTRQSRCEFSYRQRQLIKEPKISCARKIKIPAFGSW